jgi:hypothetical protein
LLKATGFFKARTAPSNWEEKHFDCEGIGFAVRRVLPALGGKKNRVRRSIWGKQECDYQLFKI